MIMHGKILKILNSIFEMSKIPITANRTDAGAVIVSITKPRSRLETGFDDSPVLVCLSAALGKLRMIQPGVKAVSAQQFIVVSLLDDGAVSHAENAVRAADRG